MLPALSTANSASATLSDCTVDDDENDENDVPAMKPLAKNDSDSRLSESESARNCQTDVGIANTIPQIDQTSDEWPSQEVLDGMDNQTKVRWMIKMAVVPPCWSERKVRLFGAYGMVEEASVGMLKL
ncbi:hypothetical protein FBU30_006211 [Linnemannia zychae]|nr:hypothetical protein FBU30_006211 [Linnemannia zychae]